MQPVVAYKVSSAAAARGGGRGRSRQDWGEYALSPQHPGALFLALLLIKSGSSDSGAAGFLGVSPTNGIVKADFGGGSFFSSPSS